MINGGSETISLPVFANFSQENREASFCCDSEASRRRRSPPPNRQKAFIQGKPIEQRVYLLCFTICQQNYQFVTDPVEHELSAQFDVVSSPLLHE